MITGKGDRGGSSGGKMTSFGLRTHSAWSMLSDQSASWLGVALQMYLVCCVPGEFSPSIDIPARRTLHLTSAVVYKSQSFGTFTPVKRPALASSSGSRNGPTGCGDRVRFILLNFFLESRLVSVTSFMLPGFRCTQFSSATSRCSTHPSGMTASWCIELAGLRENKQAAWSKAKWPYGLLFWYEGKTRPCGLL